jgi:hypothetical protein
MAEKIHDFTTLVAESPRRFFEGILAQMKRRASLQYRAIQLGRIEDAAGEVDAEIESADFAGALGVQGRWLARCPAEGCNGAEEVTGEEPYFLCGSCFNRDNNHQWMKVKFPRNRQAIEDTLLKRPARNRNYKPGETLTQLRNENRARGFKV